VKIAETSGFSGGFFDPFAHARVNWLCKDDGLTEERLQKRTKTAKQRLPRELPSTESS
jgi:hypothetical protein